MFPKGEFLCFPPEEVFVFPKNWYCQVSQEQIYADLREAPLSIDGSNKPSWNGICQATVDLLDTINLSYAIYTFAHKCLQMRRGKKSVIFAHRDMLNKIQSRLILNASQCNASELASICEALYILNINNRRLFDCINVQTCKKISDYRPVDLLPTIKAFHWFDIFDSELFDVLKKETYSKCDQFDAFQLCSIALVFSKYTGSEQILEKLGKEAESKISQFSPENLAFFSHVYAKANMLYKPLFFKIRDAALIKLKEFEANDLIKLVHSWNMLRIPVNPFFLRRIGEKLCATELNVLNRRLNDLSKVIVVLAGEKFKDSKLFGKLAIVFDSRAGRLAPWQIAKIAWGFASLEIKNIQALFFKISRRVLEIRQERWKEHTLGTMAYGFAKANFANPEVFDYISSTTLSLLPTFTALHLYNIVSAFAHNKIYDRPLLKKIAEHISSMKEKFNPQHLTHVIKSYEALGFGGMIH